MIEQQYWFEVNAQGLSTNTASERCYWHNLLTLLRLDEEDGRFRPEAFTVAPFGSTQHVWLITMGRGFRKKTKHCLHSGSNLIFSGTLWRMKVVLDWSMLSTCFFFKYFTFLNLKLYYLCFMIANHKSKNQHIHCIFTCIVKCPYICFGLNKSSWWISNQHIWKM